MCLEFCLGLEDYIKKIFFAHMCLKVKILLCNKSKYILYLLYSNPNRTYSDSEPRILHIDSVSDNIGVQ